MFQGIKPPGAYPVSGTAAHSGLPTPTHGEQTVKQPNFDQFQLSAQPNSREATVQKSVSRIIRQVRTRPTHAELAELKSRIASGTYQPNAREIAARMMMTEYREV